MPHPAHAHPDATEYAPYYERYVSLVPEDDVLAALEAQAAETRALLRAIPEDREGFRYAPEKWSIREVVGHVTDTERIFAYRALRFGRNDPTPLPSFDENEYARFSGAGAHPLTELAAELEEVRRATLGLFRHLPGEAWTRRGVASGYEMSVRALARVILGHERHHLRIVRERYLEGAATG